MEHYMVASGPMRSHQGFLNLNKPWGLTSHDCVSQVRRRLRLKRVGHGGTLDPAAIGVLPIALGTATRLLPYLPTRKAYRATVQLGVTTSTDDWEGEWLRQVPHPGVTLLDVQGMLGKFMGEIQQVPPAYSAIQVQGKRSYQLARSGAAVALAPRPVTIERITLLRWRSQGLVFPEVDLAITCGPGTYIRSIARDLGEALGVGGTLARLVRTQSGGFDLGNSIPLAALGPDGPWPLIPPAIALAHLPVVELDEPLTRRWYFGQRIAQGDLPVELSEGAILVVDAQGNCLGVGDFQTGVLSPQVVLLRGEMASGRSAIVAGPKAPDETTVGSVEPAVAAPEEAMRLDDAAQSIEGV
jgi:tRNA pseudouridine55 synthase